jgi:hypothetical protein
MKKVALSLLAMAVVTAVAWGLADAATAPADHVAMNASAVQWGPAPPVLPAGAKMAVLAGDPGKPGLYTVRAWFPNGYKIAPHWHPTTENLTVVSGTFHVGMGDAFDTSHADALTTGGFASMPARMHHFAWAEGDTVVQVHGEGPFTLTYVNPADDPSKAAQPVKP